MNALRRPRLNSCVVTVAVLTRRSRSIVAWARPGMDPPSLPRRAGSPHPAAADGGNQLSPCGKRLGVIVGWVIHKALHLLRLERNVGVTDHHRPRDCIDPDRDHPDDDPEAAAG